MHEHVISVINYLPITNCSSCCGSYYECIYAHYKPGSQWKLNVATVTEILIYTDTYLN